MRTTITIQDTLLARAKEEARRRNCSLGEVVDEALRRTLLDRKGSAREAPVELTLFRGEGVAPGINLDSHAALMDLMEGR